jgi:molecular chaperone GrpE (heat shock protein)
MPTRIQLLTLSVSTGVIALILIAVWLWRRKFTNGPDATSDPEFGENPVRSQLKTRTDAPSGQTAGLESLKRSAEQDLTEVILRIHDPEIRCFLEEIAARIQEEMPNLGAETSMNFIEEMIDRVDDLAAITRSQNEDVTAALSTFRETILGIISACGAEIIHSDTWDPTRQRAISKEATSGITTPRILRFGSTGFRRNDQLIRKQEVVLAVPESN